MKFMVFGEDDGFVDPNAFWRHDQRAESRISINISQIFSTELAMIAMRKLCMHSSCPGCQYSQSLRGSKLRTRDLQLETFKIGAGVGARSLKYGFSMSDSVFDRPPRSVIRFTPDFARLNPFKMFFETKSRKPQACQI